MGVECSKFFADLGKCDLPLDRLVLIGTRIPSHGLRQPAFFLKIVVAPSLKFRQGMRSKETSINPPVRDLPGSCLGAVLAKF
jgi:hypothetical protein